MRSDECPPLQSVVDSAKNSAKHNTRQKELITDFHSRCPITELVAEFWISIL